MKWTGCVSPLPSWQLSPSSRPLLQVAVIGGFLRPDRLKGWRTEKSVGLNHLLLLFSCSLQVSAGGSWHCCCLPHICSLSQQKASGQRGDLWSGKNLLSTQILGRLKGSKAPGLQCPAGGYHCLLVAPGECWCKHGALKGAVTLSSPAPRA